ncbi:thiol-disulfide oxidoreductase DCC family protein [Paenibacillus senegalimassiliensis]|uniref:thiol-disulfide oxidoreductase DCC family protein n=1 Tax=Paenibacillus senegalimassiliensis TaxID=1737426 RepID=UPI00073E2CE8|nr:thiol-disulfide oxidoreductase DCC family protein [Paenibacillus senegalimassiliensis]
MPDTSTVPEYIVLFDGVCHLCQGAVKFIIKRDSKQKFHFASLQSPSARRLLKEAGLDGESLETMILIEQGVYHTRSTAALRIARALRFPWPLLYTFILVPKPWRDVVYTAIAKRRYRWFGKDEVCMMPTAELKARFLPEE